MFQRIQKFAAVLIAVIWIFLGTFQNDFLQAGGKFRIPIPDRIHLIRRLTGIVAGKKMIKSCSQAINVGSGVGLSMTSILLRRCISLGSQTCSIRYTVFFKFPGRTKVDKHNLSIRFQHDIGRLHIPVDNRRLSGMKVRKHIAELFCPFDHIFLALGSIFFHNAFQMTSFYVVHDNKKGSVSIDHIDDAGQVGVT